MVTEISVWLPPNELQFNIFDLNVPWMVSNMENGKLTDVVFLDIREAFDSVD